MCDSRVLNAETKPDLFPSIRYPFLVPLVYMLESSELGGGWGFISRMWSSDRDNAYTKNDPAECRANHSLRFSRYLDRDTRRLRSSKAF